MRRLALALAGLIGLAAPAWAGLAEGVMATFRGDYATALREFRPLAEEGDAIAQHSLGVLYEHGRGVPQDHAQAVKWYRKAAVQGNAGAQSSLALMYSKARRGRCPSRAFIASFGGTLGPGARRDREG